MNEGQTAKSTNGDHNEPHTLNKTIIQRILLFTIIIVTSTKSLTSRVNKIRCKPFSSQRKRNVVVNFVGNLLDVTTMLQHTYYIHETKIRTLPILEFVMVLA